MQCYNCGAENDENNQVCYNCGTQLYAYEAVWNQNDEDNMQNSYVGSKNTKPIIIGVIVGGLVLILAVVACCIILSFRMPKQQYQERLAEAVEYVTAGNYDMAIEVYKEAIAINDKDPESYIGIHAEFLSGMTERDKLLPIITIVILFQDQCKYRLVSACCTVIECMLSGVLVHAFRCIVH